MSLLLEATSVIIKRSSLDEKWPESFSAFIKNSSNLFCRDKFLVREGFMAIDDISAYVGMLEGYRFAIY